MAPTLRGWAAPPECCWSGKFPLALRPKLIDHSATRNGHADPMRIVIAIVIDQLSWEGRLCPLNEVAKFGRDFRFHAHPPFEGNPLR